MTDKRKTGWRRLGGGFAVSLLLHGLAVAVFLVSFDSPAELSEQQKAIEVTLVAPPEEPEVEPVLQPLDEPQEEPAEPEPPPEPEQEPATEPGAQPETPPEPATEQEAEAAPPPPPPETAPEEQAEAPPPPPPPPPPPQESEPDEQPPEPELPDSASAPIPVLRPVVRFGERDSGPEVSEGTEAEPETTEEPQAAEQADAPSEAAPTLAQPEITLPEAPPMEGGLPEVAEETLMGAGEAEASASDQPADPAVVKAVTEAALKPREVTELFSSAISGDRAAMTAMAGLSRKERGDQLCGTELSQQLRNGSPSYVPYLLPILRLQEGNVVDVPLAAFRDINGTWINIAVRCEVDDNATEVVRFSLSVGKTVPRAEWAERGFPDS